MSLLNELEDVRTYLEKEDTFFYSMVYDPNQKTLLVDKGEIRVGLDYQAEVSPYISPGMREGRWGGSGGEGEGGREGMFSDGGCSNRQSAERRSSMQLPRCGSPTECLTIRWSSFWWLQGI